MSRLPLHVLPTFCTVARLANLRAAADELHLTHSAVSQQIKLLEEQLGFQVFDRRGRRIALNAAGRALLRSAGPALAMLDEGMQAAAAAAAGSEQRVRLTVLPSFAQRWLLPRMGRWHAAHPRIALEIDASQQLVDVQREGYHAALRQGSGHWPPLVAQRLVDSPLVVVGSPAAARRLLGQGAAAIAHEALLGNPGVWEHWFEQAGLARQRINPVATFNDAGLMLQAAEQNLGLAIVREVLAVDALADGRLMRLHPLGIEHDGSDSYYLAYPPALAEWPPIQALLQWLREELRAGTGPAGR
ncbi:MAG: LysR substrate-binding domain-containing protein [Aquincola tertiaricarbonis]|uniref:LysR substrate-binding domain-containing protein n=1 Tax=Aquincola TaxID=391952 RepID=UPI000614A362|nr:MULTISPECIES: LysR substrate-binding domain-containing protein [Aquincola]MCR5868468.1 LysR substrate-binding domain-containing protein [Aquincola sp. J276]